MKIFNLFKNKVPQNKVPQNKVPQNKVPQNKVPQNKVPQNEVPQNKVPPFEPRVYSSMHLKNNKLEVNDLKRSVPQQNYHLSSIVCLKNHKGLLKENNQAVRFFEDTSFIGFKDKYQYFFLYDENISLVSIREFFSHEYFRKSSFSCFRNAFIYNPEGILSLTIRYSAPLIRLNVIIDRSSVIEYNDNWVFNNYKDIDVLVIPEEELEKFGLLPLRKIITYKDTSSIKNSLIATILDNSNKAVDVLLHVYGEYELLPNIDDLNSGLYDVVIKLKTGVDKSKIFTNKYFKDNIKVVFDSVDFILVRESILLRYYHLLTTNQILDFLKYSCIDGVSYDIL